MSGTGTVTVRVSLRAQPMATITSPFSTTIKHHCENQSVVLCRHGHPFDGQDIAVLGSRRREGSSRLIVEAAFADGSRQWIPAAWTSLEQPLSRELAIHGLLADFMAMADLVGALRRRQADGAGADPAEPAGMAGAAAAPGGDCGGRPSGVHRGAGRSDDPCGGSGAGR